MVKMSDSFISLHAINTTEDMRHDADCLVNTIASVSGVIYQSLYVVDYLRQKFLYVSDNPLFLCGNTADEVKKMGFQYYFRNVPEKEQGMMTELNRAGFYFLNQIPVSERTDYAMGYDFHLLNGTHQMLVHHQITPLMLLNAGEVWLAACAVSLSSHSNAGNLIMRKIGQADFWEYAFDDHAWHMNVGAKLNVREKNILSLSARGYTVPEIADKLHVSQETIKTNKKNLFEKLDVENIVEALIFATNYKLL
jgi:DNA-binding CsgD family transcriptional regulator